MSVRFAFPNRTLLAHMFSKELRAGGKFVSAGAQTPPVHKAVSGSRLMERPPSPGTDPSSPRRHGTRGMGKGETVA